MQNVVIEEACRHRLSLAEFESLTLFVQASLHKRPSYIKVLFLVLLLFSSPAPPLDHVPATGLFITLVSLFFFDSKTSASSTCGSPLARQLTPWL